MKLHFHVIIESEFKYDRKEAQVYVRFKDPSRGIYVGSIEPQQELQKVRLVLSCCYIFYFILHKKEKHL